MIFTTLRATLALSILANALALPAIARAAAPTVPATSVTPEHRIYGIVASAQGMTVVLRTRDGHELTVNRQGAKSFVAFTRGRAIIVYGKLAPNGVLQASAIWRTFPDAAHWPADR